MQAKLRQQVHQKYAGRCAYCGDEITIKQMHVDHLKPIYRGWGDNHPLPPGAGTDTPDNMMPACKVCNLWKKTFSLEEFREEIAAQAARLRRDSAAFRMAERYGQIKETFEPVIFYFELQGASE